MTKNLINLKKQYQFIAYLIILSIATKQQFAQYFLTTKRKESIMKTLKKLKTLSRVLSFASYLIVNFNCLYWIWKTKTDWIISSIVMTLFLAYYGQNSYIRLHEYMWCIGMFVAQIKTHTICAELNSQALELRAFKPFWKLSTSIYPINKFY